MTGREMILYILQNGLENEPVVKDGKVMGFLTVGEAAEKMDTGRATIVALMHQGIIEGVLIGDRYYIPANFDLKTSKETEQTR